MKSLADQSKAATVQIRRLLGAIQKQSNDAVLMTEASTRGLDNASTAAEDVGTALRTLAEAVASASQAVAQIAASARQQAGGLQQINQAMRDVAAVANQNLATTRQVGQAARDLTMLGTTLRAAFGQRPDGRA
jgi:methyl-accepting chemotaxis protein